MVEVHTCPFCELRFSMRVEVEYHIATDHPGHLERVDDDTVPASDGEPGATS